MRIQAESEKAANLVCDAARKYLTGKGVLFAVNQCVSALDDDGYGVTVDDRIASVFKRRSDIG